MEVHEELTAAQPWMQEVQWVKEDVKNVCPYIYISPCMYVMIRQDRDEFGRCAGQSGVSYLVYWCLWESEVLASLSVSLCLNTRMNY